MLLIDGDRKCYFPELAVEGQRSAGLKFAGGARLHGAQDKSRIGKLRGLLPFQHVFIAAGIARLDVAEMKPKRDLLNALFFGINGDNCPEVRQLSNKGSDCGLDHDIDVRLRRIDDERRRGGGCEGEESEGQKEKATHDIPLLILADAIFKPGPGKRGSPLWSMCLPTGRGHPAIIVLPAFRMPSKPRRRGCCCRAHWRRRRRNSSARAD